VSGPVEASGVATRRLVLRPLRVEDADEMVTVLADPALHEFMPVGPLVVWVVSPMVWRCSPPGSGSG